LLIYEKKYLPLNLGGEKVISSLQKYLDSFLQHRSINKVTNTLDTLFVGLLILVSIILVYFFAEMFHFNVSIPKWGDLPKLDISVFEEMPGCYENYEETHGVLKAWRDKGESIVKNSATSIKKAMGHANKQYFKLLFISMLSLISFVFLFIYSASFKIVFLGLKSAKEENSDLQNKVQEEKEGGEEALLKYKVEVEKDLLEGQGAVERAKSTVTDAIKNRDVYAEQAATKARKEIREKTYLQIEKLNEVLDARDEEIKRLKSRLHLAGVAID